MLTAGKACSILVVCVALLLASPLPLSRKFLGYGSVWARTWRHPECSRLQGAVASYRLVFGSSAPEARGADSLRHRRAEGNLEEWDSELGRFWIPKGNQGSLAYLMAEYERGSNRGTVKKGDVVLDCGANVGTFTREALNAGARLVVAIEPLPVNIESLKRTFEKEISAGTVVVYGKGVWDKAEATLMTVPANTELGTVVMHQEVKSLGEKTESVSVDLVTIDQLVKELHLPSVDAIKMDIEGAERKALAGAASTLKQFRPGLAIAGYHLADDPEAVSALLRHSGVNYERGPCSCFLVFGRIMPETLFYRPL